MWPIFLNILIKLNLKPQYIVVGPLTFRITDSFVLQAYLLSGFVENNLSGLKWGYYLISLSMSEAAPRID